MAKKTVWKSFIKNRLDAVQAEDAYRSLQVFDSFQPGYLIRGGKKFLNLCANDYLGLSADQESMDEGKVLAEILPIGSGASRLVTGNLAIHKELERVLTEWKGAEASLVFASGYQTNTGVIAALAGKGDVIFADKLNHASLIDGCLLSGAIFHRYQHNDMTDLRSLLKSKRGKKKIIITDGVFSMDGDIAPLKDLVKIAKRYGALLLIDDAHGTGVLGPDGAGSLSHYGIPWEDNIILMGTLSKAIGCQGGFICATQDIIDYLINFCRSFIYSTGLSPWMAAMSHFNICRIRTEKNILEKSRQSISTMKQSLRKYGIEIDDHPTPIIPIMLGESKRALRCAAAMLENDIVAAAIRPKTVPEGTARIRLSVCAAHQENDLDKAAQILADILNNEEMA
jgi:8-amino-7-oxononanoate synthase